MQRYIIISLIFIASCVSGQQNFTDSLLNFEYSMYKSSNDTVRNHLLIKKFGYYLSSGMITGSALNEAKRVNLHLVSDSIEKTRFLWNAAIVSYILAEPDYSKFFIDGYAELTGDSSVSFYVLYYLINNFSGSAQASEALKILTNSDTIFNDLACLQKVASYEKKHENLYLLASAVIPGSGTIANGAVLKGIASFGLTAGSVFGVVKLIEHGLWVNALLWGTGAGLKFYAGNILLTERTFIKAEERKQKKLADACELRIQKILEKYPLNLRE